MNNRWMHLLQRLAGAGVAAVLMSGLAVGCDNVEFGGVAFRVESPQYERAMPAEAPPDSVAAGPVPELPEGEVVFHVVRTDVAGAALIEPVAERIGGSLRAVGPESPDVADAYVEAFTTRYYGPGSAYALYRAGSPVGSFYVEEPEVSGSGQCRRIRARGYVELRPRADTLSEFLAGPDRARGGATRLEAPPVRADMSAMAQILARRGLNERDAAGSWRVQRAADLRALSIGTGEYGFAATFLFGDRLGIGSPADSAGMLFLVADFSSAVGFFPRFFDFEQYGPGHKRVLRWIDQRDVLGDSTPEWILRGYGDTHAWYEVLARSDTLRVQAWTSRQPVCEARAAQGGGGT